MSVRDLSLEAEAAAKVIASLRDAGEDPELLAGMVEGETGLMEVIDALLARMVDYKAIADGLASVIAGLQARQKRAQDGYDNTRAQVEQAMTLATLDKAQRPIATLSLSKRPASVIIIDEAAIPSRFWRTPDPVIDRKALGEALKAATAVPGATLSNAAPTLTVRFA